MVRPRARQPADAGRRRSRWQGLARHPPLPIPHGADHYWLTQTLQREALLLDMEAPQLLQVNGNAPAAWTAPVTNPRIPCSAAGSAA
jgi:hypothetical protein